MLQIKRIYEDPTNSDGYRILVDRIWPRGVSKEKAKIDLWLKDIAPSNELREWFNHKPERFVSFTAKYKEELKSNSALEQLVGLTKEHSSVTLLYSAHDQEHNQAVVLKSYLDAL